MKRIVKRRKKNIMHYDGGWSPGGQMYLENGVLWGINYQLQTGMVGRKEEVEKWISDSSFVHPNGVVNNILILERMGLDEL